MVYLKKGRFPIVRYNKLNMRNFGPCKTLTRFDSRNAYEVDFLNDVDILLLFKVVDFYEYREVDFSEPYGSNVEQ